MFQEFYRPLRSSGLLNQSQLATIFINLPQLVAISAHFRRKLASAVDAARARQDLVRPSQLGLRSRSFMAGCHLQDLASVDVGQLFLDSSSSLLVAFATYCAAHGEALQLLEQLESERELLRVFLDVSQADNKRLRRMHIKTFLVLPVQRVVK